MIRRWLMSILETEIRAVVRDEVDLYLLELGLDDRLGQADIATSAGLLTGMAWRRDIIDGTDGVIGYKPTDLR